MVEKIKVPAERKAGIYIHVPFCIKKCPYCDFYSIENLDLREDYVRAVMDEMSMTEQKPDSVDTIYFGGGTPSLLSPQQVGALLEGAGRHFSADPESEITLEVNPGTVSPENFQDYVKAGVNRINIGIQSFSQRNLSFLGRLHSSEQARRSIVYARKAGFKNLGLDLIYGLPGQEKAHWLSDLKTAAEYAPEHISCYMLTLEPDTPMYTQLQAGKLNPFLDEEVKLLFETAMDELSARGYFHYEISNFARMEPQGTNHPDGVKFQSRHNRKYWSGDPYLGFGPAAHSYRSPVRSWNMRSVVGYINAVSAGLSPVSGKETLTREQEMMEAVYLGLRTAEGIDSQLFEKRFNISFLDMAEPLIDDLIRRGLLMMPSHHIRLTKRGRLFLDTVAGELVEKIGN